MPEQTTYSCRCEKHEISILVHTLVVIDPFALLIIISNASRTVNFKHMNSIGKYVGIIGIQSINTSLNFPFKIVALMMLFIIFFTESLVPLNDHCGFMFQKMTVSPIFNVRTCGEILGDELKYSVLLTISSWWTHNILLISVIFTLDAEIDGIDFIVFWVICCFRSLGYWFL